MDVMSSYDMVRQDAVIHSMLQSRLVKAGYQLHYLRHLWMPLHYVHASYQEKG